MILSDKQLAALNKHFDSLNEEFGKELDLKTLAEQNLIKVETKELAEVMETLSRLESKIDKLIELEIAEQEAEREEEEKSLSIKEVIAAKNLKVTLSEDNSQIKSTVSMKMARKSKREDYYPTDEELALINSKITKEDKPKEAGYVFELQAADDLVDRGYERFSKQALQKMADLAVQNQIPVLLADNGVWGDHEWLAKNARAVVFDAFVEKGKLIYKAYFPTTEKNKDVIDEIFAGLLSKLSVGFAMEVTDYECSSCKCPLVSSKCPHQPNTKDTAGNLVVAIIKDVMDNFEVSLVAVPMQSAAHVRRNSAEDLKDLSIKHSIKMEETHNSIMKDLSAQINKDTYLTSNELKEAYENSIKDNIVISDIGGVKTYQFKLDYKTFESFSTYEYSISLLCSYEDHGPEILYQTRKLPTIDDPPLLLDLKSNFKEVAAEIYLKDRKEPIYLTVGRNSDSGKILNDTIQDNRMEDNKELAEKDETVVDPATVETKDASPANDELNSLKEKVEALTAELKALAEKEVVVQEVKNIDTSALELKLDNLSKSVAESLASLAKALEVINENLAKVDDKVEKSATSPAVLKTQSYKEETEQHPIVGLLSNLRKQ